MPPHRHMMLLRLNLPKEDHKALRDDDTVTTSQVVRDALAEYADGKTEVGLPKGEETVTTSVMVPPDVFDKAKERAKLDGVPLNKILTRIIHNRLHRHLSEEVAGPHSGEARTNRRLLLHRRRSDRSDDR